MFLSKCVYTAEAVLALIPGPTYTRTSALVWGACLRPASSGMATEALYPPARRWILTFVSVRAQPPAARRPKIIAVIGFGGGGHEATVRGVRDVMVEAGSALCPCFERGRIERAFAACGSLSRDSGGRRRSGCLLPAFSSSHLA